MAEVKFLVTVDEETGKITRVQRVEAGDALVDVPLEDVLKPPTTVVAGAGTTVVVNIYGGGGEPRKEDLVLRALREPEYLNPRR